MLHWSVSLKKTCRGHTMNASIRSRISDLPYHQEKVISIITRQISLTRSEVYQMDQSVEMISLQSWHEFSLNFLYLGMWFLRNFCACIFTFFLHENVRTLHIKSGELGINLLSEIYECCRSLTFTWLVVCGMSIKINSGDEWRINWLNEHVVILSMEWLKCIL